MQKIVTFLWFEDSKAEEAVNFYTSIFKNSKIINTVRYGEAGPGPEGAVMSMTFQLEGQEFYALNDNPQFKFNESLSLFVKCDTQEEIDELWGKLSESGMELGPGWIKDKFGLAWQIVPTILGDYINDTDKEKSQRVMHAMMQMNKLDIEKLTLAHAGK
mgnify:CR=1 FL=1